MPYSRELVLSVWSHNGFYLYRKASFSTLSTEVAWTQWATNSSSTQPVVCKHQGPWRNGWNPIYGRKCTKWTWITFHMRRQGSHPSSRVMWRGLGSQPRQPHPSTSRWKRTICVWIHDASWYFFKSRFWKTEGITLLRTFSFCLSYAMYLGGN